MLAAELRRGKRAVEGACWGIDQHVHATSLHSFGGRRDEKGIPRSWLAQFSACSFGAGANHLVIGDDALPGAYGRELVQILPLLEVKSWEELFRKDVIARLEARIFPAYMMQLRWVGGKGRVIEFMEIVHHAEVELPDYSAVFFLIQVSYQSGLPDIYQLPVSFAPQPMASKLQEASPKSIISRMIIDGVDGQRNAVERDRALGRDEPGEVGRHPEAEAARVALPLDRDDLGQPVDVPRDDVPAQFVAEPERPLQVDARARPPGSQGGALERLGGGLDHEPPCADLQGSE